MRDHMPLGNPFGGARGLAAALLLTVAATGSGHAQNYSVVYSFQCETDGSGPFSSLIADSAGNLYGTTLAGGAFDAGTVYRVSPDGTETVLHSFAGGPNDGASPYAGLVRDSAGNLYGTTFEGGANGLIGGGSGTVFEVSANGTETVLYSFGASSTDGFAPQGALVRDAAGNLYGTTYAGGTQGGGTVFRLSLSGKETLLHSFAAPGSVGGDGSSPEGNLVPDGAGSLYGSTPTGGTGSCLNGCGTLFKVNKAGDEAVLYSFAGPPMDGAHPQSGLLRDATGNLYGVTPDGGTLCSMSGGCGTVLKLTLNGTETALFSFSGGGSGDYPYGNLVQDGRGNLYGTTVDGGSMACQAGGCGVVFQLGPTGKEGALHKFAGPPVDGSFPAGLLFSGGALYGVTANGGAYNCGTVFKITP